VLKSKIDNPMLRFLMKNRYYIIAVIFFSFMISSCGKSNKTANSNSEKIESKEEASNIDIDRGIENLLT